MGLLDQARDFTTGWEYGKHQVRMFALASLFHILLSLIVAVVLTMGTFRVMYGGFKYEYIFDYAKAAWWRTHPPSVFFDGDSTYHFPRSEGDREGYVQVTKDTVAYDWYVENVYHVEYGSIFWRYIVVLVFYTGALSYIFHRAVFSRIGKSVRADERLRGSKRIDAQSLFEELFTSGKASDIVLGTFRAKSRSGPLKGRGGRITSMPLAGEDGECKHVIVMGSPGSGKSTAIKQYVDSVERYISQNGGKAVIVDVKGEYISNYFGGPEGKRNDVLLIPKDARSAAWTPWADADDSEDFRSMASALIPTNPQAKEQYFDIGAQIFVASMWEALAEQGKTTNAEFFNILNYSETKELYELLKGKPGAKYVAPDQQTTAANIVSSAMNYCSAFRNLPDPKDGEKPFSWNRWMQSDEPSFAFIAARPVDLTTYRPVMTMWLHRAAMALLSMPEDLNRRRFFVIDELPALNEVPSIPQLMSLGRSYGAAVLIGVQLFPQLKKIYGDDIASAMDGLCATKLGLMTSDADTANWVERMFGRVEQREKSKTISTGISDFRDGVSYTEHRQERALIMASEFSNLHAPEAGNANYDRVDGHGYLKPAGDYPTAKVKLWIEERRQRAEPFVPRKKEDL